MGVAFTREGAVHVVCVSCISVGLFLGLSIH